MVDLKDCTYLKLQQNNIIVKKYKSDSEAIEDLEKLVFKDYAIALGDYSTDRILFAVGIDKIYHRLNLILITKSQTAKNAIVHTIQNLQRLLRLSFDEYPSLSISHITRQSETVSFNDRIDYLILELKAVEFEQLP